MGIDQLEKTEHFYKSSELLEYTSCFFLEEEQYIETHFQTIVVGQSSFETFLHAFDIPYVFNQETNYIERNPDKKLKELYEIFRCTIIASDCNHTHQNQSK